MLNIIDLARNLPHLNSTKFYNNNDDNDNDNVKKEGRENGSSRGEAMMLDFQYNNYDSRSE
jgi:hypothetical protein